MDACINQKCSNPCVGSCGISALCQVVSHNPICSCPERMTGNPFIRCIPMRKNLLENFCSYNFFICSTIKQIYLKINNITAIEQPVQDPCQPSPCGPNSQCRVINNTPSCSCMPEFIGSPPYCKPECISNDECLNKLACINQKCKDPCIGTCGANAVCNVITHTPICTCVAEFTGDPFTQCNAQQRKHFNQTILNQNFGFNLKRT